MLSRRAQSRLVIAALLLVLGIAAGGLWWLCERSNTIAFLPAQRGAAWVVYPRPAEAMKQAATPVSAVFRSTLILSNPPAKTILSFRAFKTAAVTINERTVPTPPSRLAGWKLPVSVDVTGFLVAGTNTLVAWVTNAAGPPALWLRLETGESSLATAESWEVSRGGGAWRRARLAATPPEIGPSNPLYGSETTLGSLKRAWPVLAVLFAISLLSPLFVERLRRARTLPGVVGRILTPGKWPFVLLAMVIIVRAAFLFHNLPLLPRNLGFDALDHEEYVRFIQEKHALPLPNDGWEMHQPPLYYASGALLLDVCGMSTDQDSAIAVLRSLNGVAGLLQCWLVLLCLRRLFPGESSAQAAGLLVAAFLPFNLYLSQYVTNEPLPGLFVTAAFYFFLRALDADHTLWHLGIGVALGAAALTKFTSLLAFPLFPAALAMRLILRKDYALRNWLRAPGLVMISCLLICGWHYGRVWAQPGQPLVGNWESVSALAWWQDPGFRTSTFYLRFGQALVSPLFSAYHSFADGIYSTLWGDGLASGVACLAFRPPWNYDLMGAAYLLALGPCLLLAAGLAVVLGRFIRRPTAEWFVALGVVSLFGVAIFYLSLRVPSLGSVKAFYLFPAAAPLSAFVTAGWLCLAQGHRAMRNILCVILLTWTLAVCGAFWIRPGNPQVEFVRGLCLAHYQRNAEAVESLSRALKMNEGVTRSGERPLLKPGEAEAHRVLAEMFSQEGNSREAVTHYNRFIEVEPKHASALNNFAWILATDPDERIRSGPRAVELAERACQLTEWKQAFFMGTLAAAYAEAGRFSDAVAMAQKARDQARADKLEEVAKRNQELLGLYRASKPYHEER